MARLPNPGGDDGSWGAILNAFLAVEHNADGTLKDVARQSDIAAGAADGSITTAKLNDGAVTNAKVSNSAAIAKSKLAPLDVGDSDITSSGLTNAALSSTAGIVATKLASSVQTSLTKADNALPKRTIASVVTSAGALVVNQHNPVDASGGPLTLTLPTGQAAGTVLSVEKRDTSTNAITVSGSIRGSAGTITLSLALESVEFITDSSGSWVPTADHKTLSTLDARFRDSVILPAPTGNSTGDSALINAFLAAQSPGTRITSLPGRTYLLDAPIILLPGLHYDFAHYYPNSVAIPPGSSVTGTIFRQASGANLDYMVATPAYSTGAAGAMDKPVWISGLYLDGNKANQTGGAGHGLVISACRSTLHRVFVVNARGHGIFMSDKGADTTQLTGTGIENRIEECTVDSPGGYGIYVTKGNNLNTDGWIVSCVVSSAGLEGIKIDSPAGWTVFGCHLWATTLSAITTTGSYSTRIFDNYIEGYGGSPGVAAPVTTYAAGTTYSRYQIVFNSGALYYSLVDSNIGNAPASSPTQWFTIPSGVAVYGIACFTMGYPRPTHIHDNQISLGHVTQALSSNLNYRGILFQSPTSNTSYGMCHDNVVQNELQPAGTNTLALRYGVQSTGVLDITSHHNRILGNWNANTSIDGTVVTASTTF